MNFLSRSQLDNISVLDSLTLFKMFTRYEPGVFGNFIFSLIARTCSETVLIQYLPIALFSKEAGGLLSMIFYN